MKDNKLATCSVVFATLLSISYGCQIINPSESPFISATIYDTLAAGEEVITLSTENIAEIINVSQNENIRGGPYFDVSSIENSQFVVRTNSEFARYEHFETLQTVSLSLTVRCAGTVGQQIRINIIDTNNNKPEFIPTNELEFDIIPPLPPGHFLTGCCNGVINVRDIDLTTQSINFTIEDNQYFEIIYDGRAAEKEFVGQIRTKTLIRSLNEPIILFIFATDEDQTGDPRLTTNATLRITASDTEFQLPEELVFNQTFYLANYTDDHQLNMLETISLRQGYDEYVNFTLEDYYEYFELKEDGNQISIVVMNNLPNEMWSERQIYLIVSANREFTTGASTTVIVHLPEEIELQFDRTVYQGVIENNNLRIAPLVLSQGHDGITAHIVGEHESYFTPTVESDLVTLTMTPLIDDIIDNNSFIWIEVIATSGYSSASTVVNLEIIKEDKNTPVLNKFVYSGSYDPATGLNIEEIRFEQGFDTTVTVKLSGDNYEYFQIAEIGEIVTINSSTIPPEMFSQQKILITLEASKPQTVGAHAALYITLPAARELEFEKSTYRGSLEGSSIRLQTITLLRGYDAGVSFNLSGEYASHFTITNDQENVTIDLPEPLPDTATSNNVILLTLTASGLNSITTNTSILLDIIKDDTTTPVFSQPIYYGTYSEGAIKIEPINLIQGYDSNVTFRIDGGDAKYFAIDDNATITLQLPIPEDIIFSEKVLLFSVLADKAFTVGASAAVVIRFPTDLTESTVMKFSRHTYIGILDENEFNLEQIVLDTGFAPATEFIISGEYAEHFSWSITSNIIQISSLDTLPDEVKEVNDFIVLEVEARRPRAVSVWTSIIIHIVKQEITAPVFDQAYYTGSYTEETGLMFEEIISLSEGYDETVTFSINGAPEAWFSLEQEGEYLTLVSHSPVPPEVLESNNQLLFTIIATKANNTSGRAVIYLDLPKGSSLKFQQSFYRGKIENGSLELDDIILEDYTNSVIYSFTGDYVEYFLLSNQNGTFSIEIDTSDSNEILEQTQLFVFTLEVHNMFNTTHTVIVIENIGTYVEKQQIEFEQPFYVGSYSTREQLQFDAEIRLAADSNQDVVFDLEGDDAVWFNLEPNGNSVTVIMNRVITPGVIQNNQQLVFVVTARSPGSATAKATVVISLMDSSPKTLVLGFEHVSYLGSIENSQANIPSITLREGFTQDVNFTLHGDLKDYFSLAPQGATVTISLEDVIPENLIPGNRIIMLEIQASALEAITAYATIVIEYIIDEDVHPLAELVFAQTFYNGSFAAATGLTFPTAISLAQGYNSEVLFDLEGDDAIWFYLVQDGNSLTVILASAISPDVIENNQRLVFVVTAQSPESATARTVVIIHILDDSQPGLDVKFEKNVYEGSVRNDIVSHEIITVIGFSGSTVELHGEHSSKFDASLLNDRVTVSASGSLTLPSDATYVILELRAGTASAVLVLNVIETDIQPPVTPSVAFDSPSYAVRVDVSQTGLVGQVQASADNGEAVTYFLQLDDAHLQQRMSINAAGELRVSAPLTSGFYIFEVVATTVFSQVQGTAPVHLSVEAVTICGDELVMPPLIVLKIDEEEPHRDLINGTRCDDCHFTLTNHWPLNQTWVYVDQEGLHTIAIDREHDSIAFMALSQVQVEIILHCDRDPTRIKRSLASDVLGPYEYGSNEWILTDTILYNARRSMVNIIVNDINDNTPIFVGKENEPIAVGYPVPELAEIIRPRCLAELQATDADIGENAALLYWSTAPELAVSPTTGFVHLRVGATLENGARLTINATDRHGEGLTGSIDIMVRLLDENYLAVVTIRNAFFDDEETILSVLSEAVGYDIKVLKSEVISHEAETTTSRNMKSVTSEAGASLQLYVYGLINREPVPVDRLLANIVTAPVSIASSVSLQDHLEGQEICVISGRDTGLLVATIVLSVFLFIVLVLIAVWFFLRWRKNKNYDEFSDENSLASRNSSVDQLSKPEISAKPRLDIAELKRSEKRLQERLDAPIEAISIEPASSKIDAIVNIPEKINSEHDTSFKKPELIMPIVIQSIDKLKDAEDDSSGDVFGEIKTQRRKSVVTFNENVEKIIHVEDTPDPEDPNEEPEYGVNFFSKL